mmetsp:Transcript_34864/g.105084  ORF Transcript_34864/g.105084 Transcript_34864/m.105084 type:complete len:377 (-) Transcript_34864:77-1207(-)
MAAAPARPAKKVRLDALVQYEPVPLHFKVPHGIFIHEATSVAVDSKDFCYCFNRGNMPVLVFDPEGNLERMWGNPTPYEGTVEVTDPYGNKASRWVGTEFVRPHAITIDHEDNVWLVDDMANTITKCTTNGDRRMMLGPAGFVTTDKAEMKRLAGTTLPAPGASQSGDMFNRPTDIAVHPRTGELFVSDGYGNSCVHRFTPDGKHLQTWGSSGTDPGQFAIPHNIAILPGAAGVIVADRENSRVQLFGLDGSFQDEWHIHRAVSVSVFGDRIYVAEQGATSRVHKGKGYQISELSTWTRDIGHRVGIYTSAGHRLQTIGAPLPGERPDQFNWLHGVAVDSKGDLYAAEVSFCECGKHQRPHARELVSLRKWRCIKP